MRSASRLGLAVGLGTMSCMGTPAAAITDTLDSPKSGERGEVCGEVMLELYAPAEGPPSHRPGLRAPAGRKVVAKWYDSRIYIQPDTSSLVIGYARRGHQVGVRGTTTGEGCQGNMWYVLDGGGYACASREFRTIETFVKNPVPIADEPLPYGYAKVTRDGALRYKSLPTAGDGSNARAMTGAYFVTVVETVEHEGESFYRTDGGDYVRADDVALLSPPDFAGELLTDGYELPLAFVHAVEAPIYCDCDRDFAPCGTARRMARFIPTEEKFIDGSMYVRLSDEAWIAREAVRIAKPLERPAKIGEQDSWIHIDLVEQVLVAYEGDEAVFATLVSTGAQGHTTPTGTWRVDRKYLSTTMTGPDEEKGTYTVSEVPWTMFYHGAYAIHGAYWHSEFGTVRSHGCTNLPPADARWLFIWAGGVPPGWHAQANALGPWVHITAETQPPITP